MRGNHCRKCLEAVLSSGHGEWWKEKPELKRLLQSVFFSVFIPWILLQKGVPSAPTLGKVEYCIAFMGIHSQHQQAEGPKEAHWSISVPQSQRGNTASSEVSVFSRVRHNCAHDCNKDSLLVPSSAGTVETEPFHNRQRVCHEVTSTPSLFQPIFIEYLLCT